mgnify:FL=1
MNDNQRKIWAIIVECCKDRRHSVSVSTENRRAAIITVDSYIDTMEKILYEIASQGCENYTTLDCWAAGRDPTSILGALRVCNPCLAKKFKEVKENK